MKMILPTSEILMFICTQKINFILTSFSRYCKSFANLLLWVLCECLIMSTKILVSPYRKFGCPKCWNQLWCLFACKSTSSLPSFFRYCKDIAYLLFSEFWERLTIPIKTIVLIWRKPSCWSACKKSTSLLAYFVRYCKEIADLSFLVI